MILLWILLGILGLWVIRWWLDAASSGGKRPLWPVASWLAAVVGVVLLVRFGFAWLAGAVAVALGALRWLGPVAVKLLAPLLVQFGRQRMGRIGKPSKDTALQESTMSRSEALEVLGLAEGASETAIRAAHAELIKKVHPDLGGTAYLAARVNLARDLLLKQARH